MHGSAAACTAAANIPSWEVLYGRISPGPTQVPSQFPARIGYT